MAEYNDLKFKNRKRKAIFLLTLGLLTALISLYKLLFLDAQVFVSSYKKLLTVSNGSIGLLIGIGLIIGGIIHFIHRNEKESL